MFPCSHSLWSAEHLVQHPLVSSSVAKLTARTRTRPHPQPNLRPPITTLSQVMEYREALLCVDPSVRYLMSLYLHASMTPESIGQAAAALVRAAEGRQGSKQPGGPTSIQQHAVRPVTDHDQQMVRAVWGVKVYPAGVTTNSEHGVTSLESFYPLLEVMEQMDLVLNLHGEVAVRPATASAGDTDEELFLPTLHQLHARFPKLRIVLEHCTTAAAVEAVKKCTRGVVAATITAHHLYLTNADAAVDPHAWCKPVPKAETDRDALVRAVLSGDGRFFFGSDSAPHPLASKQHPPPPAGVFTQPYATQHVISALEEALDRGVIRPEDVTQEKLEGFLCHYGRSFYKLPPVERGPGTTIVLERKGERVQTSVKSEDGSVEVGVSRGGRETWSLRWE